MAYLVKADLTPPLYQEVIDEITRGDDTIVTNQITAGISLAKTYLHRFDTDQLFNDTTPVPVDLNLKNKVKDLVCFELIKLANPNVDMAIFETAFTKAIRWFEQIKNGEFDPDGWPEKTDDANTDFPEGGTVYYTSNPQREQHL